MPQQGSYGDLARTKPVPQLVAPGRRQGIDAYDMSDPVDILRDLAKFDEDVAKTEKWALRKAVLTRLKTLAKVRFHVCKCRRNLEQFANFLPRLCTQ